VPLRQRGRRGPTLGVIDGAGIYVPPDGYVYVDYVYDVPNFGHEMGRTNYAGCGGGYGQIAGNDPKNTVAPNDWRPFAGIYYAGSQSTIGSITDGTSNTVAFVEYVGIHNGSSAGIPANSREFVLTWMGSGWLTSRWGLAPVYNANSRTLGSGTDYSWRQISSMHPGVINFAFADGSVRPISRTADYFTFVYVTGASDGRVFNYSNLGQ
jgi:prepilin-type processing-associated H-X9-DG protein